MPENANVDLLLAGGIAAFSVDLLVYPLDTLKTRYQSRDFNRLYYDQTKNKINRSALFRGLYQGAGSIILVTLPASGLFFTTYETLKDTFKRFNPTRPGSDSPLVPQPIIDGAASSVAELVACVVETPAEVVKQNAQMVQREATPNKIRTAWNLKDSPTFQTIMSFKKPSQLFRGYTALAGRNLPYTAMQFPAYEHIKNSINEKRKAEGIATGSVLEIATVTAISAGSSGSLAAVITTPIDVVKTHMMLSAFDDDAKPQDSKNPGQSSNISHKTSGGLEIARQVISESGVKGLFRGALLRAVWTAFGSGLYLSVYECTRIYLRDRRASKEESAL